MSHIIYMKFILLNRKIINYIINTEKETETM